ncbi:MAG: enoyl-CoA hydratase/isomerase family protein, partial [Roseiflexaceae bacterium]
LSRAAVAELADILHALEAPTTRAVVITGFGEKAFVAGANIKEINALADIADARQFGQVVLALGQYMRVQPYPIIAAVNGVAFGGGCELALMCDMRIASTTAKLALPEITLGLMPGWGGSVRVARRAGASTALLMALTGESIVASEALRLGLVDRVVDAAELMPATQALARRIAGMARPVVATIKATIWNGVDMVLDDALATECDTFADIVVRPNAKEGTDAFINKRAPQWDNR